MAEPLKSTERRLQVLRAIVEDYVHLREPVGSKALVERHGLDVSAATIRNDMSALEEQGLIVAPHTSSGRIPTEEGYRHFVERIEDVKPLSTAEKRAIRSLLDGADDLDDLAARTVRMLSHLTNQVAVVQLPRADEARVRHLELVLMAPSVVLGVLITSSGAVLQRTEVLGSAADESELARVRDAALTLLQGRPVSESVGLGPSLAALLPPGLHALAEDVAFVLGALAADERPTRVVTAGTANLARASQDFHGDITPVLEALEEQVVLLRLFSELDRDAHGLAVSIGVPDPASPLRGTSLVASGYGPGQAAMIGVLGPTRMDYPGSIAAVRAVARYLSRILAA